LTSLDRLLPVRRTRRLAASGRGAHAGWGGTISTGQVGPATIRPAIPECNSLPPAALHAVKHSRPAISSAAIRMSRRLVASLGVIGRNVLDGAADRRRHERQP
jgi:hypothetical protein